MTVMLEKTQKEPGVPVYIFSTASDSPDVFYFYDLYESDEARTAQEATDEFEATMPARMQVAESVSFKKLDPYGPIKIAPRD
jgi:quinol monooxygenase YgiN